MNELKPCPFCGGEAEIKRVNERAGFGLYHESYCTMCASCGAQSKFAFVYSLSAKAAINSCVEAWNRRADKSAEKDKRIAELEAERDAAVAVICNKCEVMYYEEDIKFNCDECEWRGVREGTT